MESLVGQWLGKYQILQEIGRGAMGAVYKGYDPALQRYVAVKVLLPHLAWNAGAVERFLREARTAAQLRHPNIVTIYDVGQSGELYYFAMELLEGNSLAAVGQRFGRQPPANTVSILQQIAAALDYAHSQGLVHRDVKPANIIIGPKGRAVLTDFGIVKAVDDVRLTSAGTTLGTPGYISPEQAIGQEAGPSSDLYSLAVVAYRMLSGRLPIQVGRSIAQLGRVARETPKPIRQWRPDLPPQVDAVFNRALAKDPRARYPTAQAFVRTLQAALAGAEGRPAGRLFRRPELLLWGSIGLGAILLLALFIGLLSRPSSSPADPDRTRSVAPPEQTAWLDRSTLPPPPTPAPPIVIPTLSETPPAPFPTQVPNPTPSPTENLHAEIEAALWEYTWTRKEAEETLNPDLLRQVCVDPYLSWKTARIEENIRDGSHWETRATDFQITSLRRMGADTVEVWTRKTETKLFFPTGSAVPDDEICGTHIYSYRNCTYNARYTMVRMGQRWYVSEAEAPYANCQGQCHR